MTQRPSPPPSSWCEVNRGHISRNLELALGLLPEGSQFCAVLKSDAYGHGISVVAPLVEEQGVDCIGITSNSEIRAVRDAGFEGRLIRLRAATFDEMDDAAPDHVEEQAGSILVAEQLRHLMDTQKYKAGVHLALNANGMSRDGLEISTPDGQQDCHRILALMGNRIVGICTHFPSNSETELHQSSTLFQQQTKWVLAHSDLKRADVLVHAGSSLTLVSGHRVQTDMFRCGAILYGILKPELGFHPTLELKARVVSLGDYPKGSTVGYDRSRRLKQDRRLACISIGYANGFGRNAFERGAIEIHDQMCPILGKISMNTIIADVTDVKNAAPGDEAIIFGDEHRRRVGADLVEPQFQTIMADLYSNWGQRNALIYR